MALYQERAEEARMRKEEIDLENLKMKVFLVHKWEIIRSRVRKFCSSIFRKESMSRK
jgi:hypothetical protein